MNRPWPSLMSAPSPPLPLNPAAEPWFLRWRMAGTIALPFALLGISRWSGAPARWDAAGVTLVMGGQLLRVWASGCLQKNQTLTVEGPFAWTRNPLYLGSLIIGLGYVLLSGVVWSASLLVIVYVLIYRPTIQFEETRLRELFGASLDDYFARVPRLLPRPPRRLTLGPLRWATLRRNREWEAAIANLIGTLLFLWA